MRTLVDIPDEQIDDLAVICEAKKVSRAEVIRQAIAVYIGTNKLVAADAFGLWSAKQPAVDGLTFQEQARAEW
jgi:Ribbon-helix-helix protein, copG family